MTSLIHPDAINIVFVVGFLAFVVGCFCVGTQVVWEHRKKKEREYELKLRELDWLRNQDGEE